MPKVLTVLRVHWVLKVHRVLSLLNVHKVLDVHPVHLIKLRTNGQQDCETSTRLRSGGRTTSYTPR